MNIESFFKLSYGIYLITSRHEEQLSGYIANTAFQVTAEPPQIAISCHKNNVSASIIEESGIFSISVLEKDTDAGLIGLFGYQSDKAEEKFGKINYKIGKTGAPVVLSHAIAYYECEVVDKFDVGSHFLFIGKVVDAELLAQDKDALIYDYFRKEMKLAAPERAPTYVDKSKIEPAKMELNPSDEKKDLGPIYVCTICAYEYDPEIGDEAMGIPPGTPFADLPEDWVCPICAAAKSAFISEN
jgi:flavin reductase (DIM6/NTAB) family NADH-FMN oxidoreductase RutF/rubredoxin